MTWLKAPKRRWKGSIDVFIVYYFSQTKEGIMSLVKKIFTRERKEQSRPAFAEAFFSDESRTDHPFSLAMHTYKQLQETANSQEEVFLFMIEDVIFSSLYATFYEQLLFTARENPHLALPLIANFEQDQAERERMISEQTENHLNFL